MAWARVAYQHRAEPLQLALHDGRHVVTSPVSGSLPGSAVVLKHAFVQADGRITMPTMG